MQGNAGDYPREPKTKGKEDHKKIKKTALENIKLRNLRETDNTCRCKEKW
jgi:hypothetical protein